MKNTVLITMIFLAGVLASCQKTLIGNTAPNTPVANFDALWQGYSDWYGLFGVNKLNWDSLYRVSRPTIHNDMTNEELYQSLCALIKPLNDIHVFLQPTTDGLPRYESSVFFRTHQLQEDFSLSLLRQKYLTGMVSIDTNLHYGFLQGNLGYLHFGEFGMPLSFYQKQVPAILEKLKDTRGLVVDIRNHGGGDDEVSRYIAGLFAADKKLFMTVRKRNGRDRMQFTEPQQWYVDPAAKGRYIKPIVLLTTRWTASRWGIPQQVDFLM
jgi:carboxyl-terminal processing protease